MPGGAMEMLAEGKAMRTYRIARMPSRQGARRGGTAIVEFAACIPLLALVVVVTFFFGWAMVNQQHVWAVDRYACWRQVRTAAVPSDDELNQAFFAGRARGFTTARDEGSDQVEQDFAGDVAAGSAAAGDLARGLVVDRFPKGLGVHAQGEFPTDVTAWQRYTGAIQSRHARSGVEWRWRQASCEAVVADQMLPSLEGALATMRSPAGNMGDFLRSLYRNGWDYHD
jgi:hypothetical protein